MFNRLDSQTIVKGSASARRAAVRRGRSALALGPFVLGLAAILAGLIPMAPAAAQGLPLIRDTEIENLLNDYAQPIFKAAPNLGGGRVQMRIVRNDSFNAFVQDGRNVFMHTGTLIQSDTPNQVIGVIAHETGHISGTHVAQMQARLARESTRMLLLRVLGIGVAIATGKGEAVAAGDEIVIRSFLDERRKQRDRRKCRVHDLAREHRNLCQVRPLEGALAVPEPGEEFLGWSGDLTGTKNPLPLMMTADKIITATFTKKPRLKLEAAQESAGRGPVRVLVTGDIGERYAIQRSENLSLWVSRGKTTNVFGTAQFSDLPGPANSRSEFYRATISP